MVDISEYIKSPLTVIQREFEASFNPQESEVIPDIEKHFHSVFNSEELLSKIPILDVSSQKNIPAGTLVRFRCMIQEEGFAPLAYQPVLELSHKSGGQKKFVSAQFFDTLPNEDWTIDETSTFNKQNKFQQKSLFYCVTPPGEASWVGRLDESFISSDEQNLVEKVDHLTVDNKQEDPIIAKKYPLPNVNHVAALVRVMSSATFKINELVEFIGITSFPVPLSSEDEGLDAYDDAGIHLATHPSLLQLHAITFKKLSSIIELPLQTTLSLPEASMLRSKILDYILPVVGGDTLSAQYILCSLFSKMHTTLGMVNLGTLHVNLITKSPGLAQTLQHIVSNLIPRSSYLPLSLQRLNEGTFCPTMKEGTIGLIAGELQGANSIIVVDESKLVEGKLESKGIANLQGLKSVIEFGKLPIDLQYHEMSVDVDIGCLVVSEGPSLLKVPTTIPIVPISDFAKDVPQVDSEFLNLARRFISTAKNNEYSISDEMSKYIESSYATARQSSIKMDQTLLLSLLELARLIALSYGGQELTQEWWQMALDWNECRQSRIDQRFKSNSTFSQNTSTISDPAR